MKRKIYILLLLIVILFTCPLYAVGTEGSNSTTEIIYRKRAKSSFSIKAYKNIPDPVKLSIYDALTGDLNELASGSKVELSNYIGSFLVNTSPLKIEDPKRQVVFSYLVTGGSTGKFTLTIDLNAFMNADESEHIDSYFELRDVKQIFTKTGSTDSANGFYYIEPDTQTHAGVSLGTVTEANNSPVFKKNDSYTVMWNVLPHNTGETQAIGELWVSQGTLLMALREKGDNSYESASTGRFEAFFTITLTSTK